MGKPHRHLPPLYLLHFYFSFYLIGKKIEKRGSPKRVSKTGWRATNPNGILILCRRVLQKPPMRLKHLLHGFRVVRDCGCALLRVHSSNQANAYAFPLTSARTMMCQTHATDYSPRPPVSVAYCTLMTMKAITSPTRPNRNVWKNTILPRPMHLPVHGQWWSRPTIHTPHSRQCTLSIGWCTLQYRQNFLVRRRKEPDAAAGTEASGENVITSSSSAAAGGVLCKHV